MPMDLPKPIVPQEVEGHLVARTITDGVDIQVPASVVLNSSDRVMACFATWCSDWRSGQTGMVIPVPADVLGEFFDTNVKISYVVERGGVRETSLVQELTMVPFDDGDPVLSSAGFVEATSTILDLANFAGDATLTCKPWPLIARGQRVWLRIHGSDSRGGAVIIAVYEGESVTAAMLVGGLSARIPRAELERLGKDTTVTIELKVAFNVIYDETRAITFPWRMYTVRSSAPRLAITVTPSVLNVGDVFTAEAFGGRPPYRFAASPSNVATIDANGSNGRALGEGESIVTATDELGEEATASLIVEGRNERFVITVTPSVLKVGDAFTAEAFGGRPPYRFAASPSNVATIDANGSNGRALGEGECIVTATDEVGEAATASLIIEGGNKSHEGFESLELEEIWGNDPRETPQMKIICSADYIAIKDGGEGGIHEPYLTGKYLFLGENSSVKLILARPIQTMRFGVVFRGYGDGFWMNLRDAAGKDVGETIIVGVLPDRVLKKWVDVTMTMPFTVIDITDWGGGCSLDNFTLG